jgi:tripartite-type tricarboxylate transporter receptor subunit TctC
MGMRPIAFACIVAATLASACPARTQSVAEFYRGKTINLDIGSSVGGGYDIHGRLLARHIGKYIPGNPTVVPRNVEGAGGLRLANILYNSAPRDGTLFGIVFRSVPFELLLGNKAAQYDATKFTWIGSTSNEVSICVAWHTSGVTSIEDLRNKELLVGSTGPNADTSIFAKVINGVLGTRMKIITGYPGGNEISLALERGELGGRCAWSWSAVKATRLAWVEQKQMHIFVQLPLSKHPDLPHVPLVIDLTRTDVERDIAKLVFARQQFAWPFVAPPGVPKDRADALRAAFNATMQDKAYLADADKAKLEIMPVAGEDITRLISEVHATPAEIVHKTIDMLK